jgi:hypothetical protein
MKVRRSRYRKSRAGFRATIGCIRGLRSEKWIRSSGNARGRDERLYVIESPTFTGTWIYTKGVVRSKSGQEVFYVLVPSKLAE